MRKQRIIVKVVAYSYNPKGIIIIYLSLIYYNYIVLT